MKRMLILSALLGGFSVTQAQEQLPREDCLKVAFFLAADLNQLTNTPIPTDPDLKRPVAVRDGDYGGMVLPECKLNSQVFSSADGEVKPVGQLWLRKLAPQKDGLVISPSHLRRVNVYTPDGSEEAICCALGVRKSSEGNLELLVYGKDPKPVLIVPLKAASGQQKNPIEMSAERTSDAGLVTLKFVGKYEASLYVTDPEA